MARLPKGSNRHFVMDRWLDILKNEPSRMVDAPVLHHYTDSFGAAGIISSGVLWAKASFSDCETCLIGSPREHRKCSLGETHLKKGWFLIFACPRASLGDRKTTLSTCEVHWHKGRKMK